MVWKYWYKCSALIYTCGLLLQKSMLANIRVTEMNYKRNKNKNRCHWIESFVHICSVLLFLFILHLPFINNFNTKSVETLDWNKNLEVLNYSTFASPGLIITVPSWAGVCLCFCFWQTGKLISPCWWFQMWNMSIIMCIFRWWSDAICWPLQSVPVQVVWGDGDQQSGERLTVLSQTPITALGEHRYGPFFR